jgi:hypothetical protein
MKDLLASPAGKIRTKVCERRPERARTPFSKLLSH